MPKTMPSPDVALKDFFKDNHVFASLFNGYFFNNEEVVCAEDLEQDDSAYTNVITINEGKTKKHKIEKINKYRDIVRRTNIGNLVILGIENQNNIHYAMPIRKMLYDVLSYTKELSAILDTLEKSSWTTDEFLSRTKNGTKITPVITVVFYTGEAPWDGPRSLHEMMNIDERIKSFVPNYPLYVVDIGHDKGLSFNNKELEELRTILSAIYSRTADTNEELINSSIVSLAGILSNDVNLYHTAAKSKGGALKMCNALEERDAVIFAEVRKELAEAKAAVQAEREAARAEREAKDAEIAELKRLLAEARGM